MTGIVTWEQTITVQNPASISRVELANIDIITAALALRDIDVAGGTFSHEALRYSSSLRLSEVAGYWTAAVLLVALPWWLGVLWLLGIV